MFTTDKADKEESNQNCWKNFKGNYFTGDAGLKEAGNFIKILGRVDDVIKTAGNKVGGSEIEKVLLTHPSVSEAAVVKRSDEIIENAIVVFVSLINTEGTPLLKEELLYERSGNWPFALDMLDREARVVGQTAEAVELFFRQGKINEDMLIDSGSAKTCFQRALEIDPGYLPALRALKGVYEHREGLGRLRDDPRAGGREDRRVLTGLA